MADSILRLKVDSQEYDNKLKRAAEGLQRYADGCRKAGGTLTQLDDGVEEFVKSLGQMETVSKTAKGSITEMTKAFTDLSVQYNKLTDEEKASPFGKALSASLDQLKGRIQDGNVEIKNINDSLNGGGGLRDALDRVAGTFGLNIEQLTKFGSILGVTTIAVKVAKDAFFSCESNVDEWGRTVRAAEGVYDSFLQSLNNGDFSGFISRIGEVITKAKEAYNALDELQTRMTIINPERTRLQARATELKAIIRREGANSEKGQAAQTELRQLEGLLSKAFKTESQLNYNAFKAQVDAKLQDANIKLNQKDYDFLMRTFSSDASYMAMRRGAKGSKGVTYEAGGSYDEGSVTSYDTRNINQKLLDLFTDEWRREYAPLLNAAFSARGGAASVLLSDARYLKSGSGGGGGSTGGGGLTPEELEAQLEASISSAWEKAMSKATLSADTFKAPEIEGASEAWQAYVDSVKSGSAEAVDSVQSLTDAFNALNKAEGVVPTGEINKEAKDSAKSFQTAASAISSVGSALSQIEDPGAKVMGIVAQAIATVAQAYAGALSSDSTTKSNIWAFIAAAAASTASMITTISSIHQATGYANGGIVGGNSYSGDNVGPVMLDAGELILNRAQQANVAQGLQGNNIHDLNLSATIKGEDIRLAINNNGRRTGRGEYVTTRFR
jgi:hypothetical protein